MTITSQISYSCNVKFHVLIIGLIIKLYSFTAFTRNEFCFALSTDWQSLVNYFTLLCCFVSYVCYAVSQYSNYIYYLACYPPQSTEQGHSHTLPRDGSYHCLPTLSASLLLLLISITTIHS